MSGDEVWWTLERSGDIEMREMIFDGATELVDFVWRAAATFSVIALAVVLMICMAMFLILVCKALVDMWGDLWP